jgi:c-di-GMP-binding flagellar brake protein YcgR
MAKERRKHRRATLEVPLDVQDVAISGKTFKATTVNLSAGGFYCKVPLYVPILTKLKISIAVPVRDEGGREEEHIISCEGMVVRTVPEKPEKGRKSYEIGCFFTDMNEYDRLLIEEYLEEKAFR